MFFNNELAKKVSNTYKRFCGEIGLSSLSLIIQGLTLNRMGVGWGGWHFFTQTIGYRSNFCSMSWPWKIGLWTCIPTLYLFYKAFFLRALHKFSPPQAFIGLKDVSHVNLTLHSIDKRYLQICATVSLQDLPNNLRRPKFKELPHRFTKIPFPLQLHMRKISSFFERYILCM